MTSWLYRIAMNACIDHRRRQSPAGVRAPFGEEAEQRMLNTAEESPGPRSAPTPASSARCSSRRSRGCPRASGIVFVMRHHQGLKLCEIAEALGLAEGTVKRQLHAAVHRLRAALQRRRMSPREAGHDALRPSRRAAPSSCTSTAS